MDIKDIEDESSVVVELINSDEKIIGGIIQESSLLEVFKLSTFEKGSIYLLRVIDGKIEFTRIEKKGIKNIRLAHSWENDQ